MQHPHTTVTFAHRCSAACVACRSQRAQRGASGRCGEWSTTNHFKKCRCSRPRSSTVLSTTAFTPLPQCLEELLSACVPTPSTQKARRRRFVHTSTSLMVRLACENTRRGCQLCLNPVTRVLALADLLPVYCTRTNKLEVDLDLVEAKQREVIDLREQAGNNVFKRFYVQLKRRTVFLATPPILTVFIILLGLFSAICLYVLFMLAITGRVIAGCDPICFVRSSSPQSVLVPRPTPGLCTTRS